MSPVSFTPIGVVRSPFHEKAEAPRQAVIAGDTEGTLVLLPGYEHALEDLEEWSHLWVLFVFDRATHYRPKVLPPRSLGRRRGLFSTRSPHRPNPIGLSAVALVRVDGLEVHVRGIDILDGSPILDIKPYVPYADAIPGASSGWLDATPDAGESRKPTPAEVVDPVARWTVDLAAVEAQLRFLDQRTVSLREPLIRALSLGPAPHPYRRIRKTADNAFRIALKEWRAAFRVEGHTLVVTRLFSGFRPRELCGEEQGRAVHREFVSLFGQGDQ